MNPKVNSAKRPEDFEVTSAKAPDSFAPISLQTDKVLESISAAPSAKRSVDVEAAPVGDITIETLPAAYQQAFVKPEPVELTETRPVFTYKAPEGYRSRVQLNEEKVVEKNDYVEQLEKELKTLKNISYESIDRLMKSICREYAISPRKLHDEFKAKHKEIPDEWVKKNSTVESVKKQYQEEVARAGVQLIADNLPILPHHKEEGMVNEEVNRRMLMLEKQLVDLKRVTIERSSNTIVHGLGHMSPGSGEVRVNRMDDVAVPNLQDGDVLIWDEEMQKWIPGQAAGSGFADLTNKVSSLENLVYQITQFLSSHTHGDIVELHGVFQVEDPSNELIEVEQSFGTDTGDDSTDTRTFLHSEDATGTTTRTGGEASGNFVDTQQFTDTIPDGDTTRFTVGTDSRGVYTLDGIAQPTVTLPRGDIIEFDLSGLTSPNQFDIYKNGELLEQGVTRFDDTNILRVRTGDVPTELNKLYYKNSDKAGMGWVIVITDH